MKKIKLLLLQLIPALLIAQTNLPGYNPQPGNPQFKGNVDCDKAVAIRNQNGLSIGSLTANSKAILDITSTTKGVLFPRMSTTQQNAISSPPEGLHIYNTDSAAICFYTSAHGWRIYHYGNMGSGASNGAYRDASGNIALGAPLTQPITAFQYTPGAGAVIWGDTLGFAATGTLPGTFWSMNLDIIDQAEIFADNFRYYHFGLENEDYLEVGIDGTVLHSRNLSIVDTGSININTVGNAHLTSYSYDGFTGGLFIDTAGKLTGVGASYTGRSDYNVFWYLNCNYTVTDDGDTLIWASVGNGVSQDFNKGNGENDQSACNLYYSVKKKISWAELTATHVPGTSKYATTVTAFPTAVDLGVNSYGNEYHLNLDSTGAKLIVGADTVMCIDTLGYPKFNNSSKGNGKVLTSDANGKGDWQAIPTQAIGGSYNQTVSAATTATITIPTQANSNYKVSVTGSNSLSKVLYYVDSKTTTQFTVNFSALTGTVAFDWVLIP